MTRALWIVLLAGCAPPVEETIAGISVIGVLALIPLIAAAVFSALSAWGLITAQRIRSGEAISRGLAAGVCIAAGCLYGATAAGGAMLIHAEQSLPEAEPLKWLVWPGPMTPSGAVLLGVAAVILLAVGGLCAVAQEAP